MNTGTITADEPLRVGVIGCGYIGTTVGAQFYATPRADVVAATDVDRDAVTNAGQLLDVPREHRYTSDAAMFEETDLDAVLIATPHTVHYDQVKAALERDVHVLCDKPLTTDLEEAKDLLRISEASDRTVMVGYQRHLNEAYVRARQRWRDGAHVPEFVTAEITQDWYDRFRGTWRTDPELSGGGFLYDTGSHLLDAVLWTTGLTPKEVDATIEFADADRRVDTRVSLTIDCLEGAIVSMSLWGRAPCVREHLHAWDNEGAVYLEGRQWEERQLSIVESDSSTVVPYFDREEQPTKAQAFIETINRGIEPPATVRDALVVTAVTEAAYESSRLDTRVSVDLE